MRFLLVLAAMAGARAQKAENTDRLERIKQRAIDDFATVPNYVCVDSIERSLSIRGESRFRRLDRVHAELAHIEGADRFSWLGDSTFQSRSPTQMIGYGASFGGDFADNHALIFKKNDTKASYAGRATMDGRSALRYEYDAPRGALGVANPDSPASRQHGARSGSIRKHSTSYKSISRATPSHRIWPVQAISDTTTYWRVLIGQRIALLPHSSEFRLTPTPMEPGDEIRRFSRIAASTLRKAL